MHLAVYLPLVAPVFAALSAGRLAARLDPRLATWLLTETALVLAGAASLDAARDLHALFEYARATN